MWWKILLLIVLLSQYPQAQTCQDADCESQDTDSTSSSSHQRANTVPSSTVSPSLSGVCDSLQKKMQDQLAEITSRHQACLDSYKIDTQGDNDQICSRSECQSLHTQMHSFKNSGEQRVTNCQADVKKFQARQAAEQQGMQTLGDALNILSSPNDAQAIASQGDLAAYESQQQGQTVAGDGSDTSSLTDDAAGDVMDSRPTDSGPSAESQLDSAADSALADDSTPTGNTGKDDSPSLSDLVAKRERIDKAIADIKDMQKRSVDFSGQGVSDAQGGMVYGALEVVKGTSDTVVNTLGEWTGGGGKAIKAGYGILTDKTLVNGVYSSFGEGESEGSSEGGKGSEAAETGFKIVGSTGDIAASLAEGASNVPEWAKFAVKDPEVLGKFGEYAKVANAPAELLGAYNAAGEPGELQPLIATSKVGSAVSTVGEFAAGQKWLLDDVGLKNFSEGSGKVFGTFTGALEGFQQIGKGAGDFSDSLSQVDAIQNRERNLLSQSNAQIQHLQELRDQLNQQILIQTLNQGPTNVNNGPNATTTLPSVPINQPNSQDQGTVVVPHP